MTMQQNSLPNSWNNKTLITDILEEGGVHIVAFKKHGKTVAKQDLVREFIRMQQYNGVNIVCMIFDTCQEWIHNFDEIGYITIPKNAVVDIRTLMLETDIDYIITQTRYTLNPDLSNYIKYFVDNHEHLLFDIEIDQIDRRECRKRVEEKFSIEKMITGYEKVYYELLNKKR